VTAAADSLVGVPKRYHPAGCIPANNWFQSLASAACAGLVAVGQLLLLLLLQAAAYVSRTPVAGQGVIAQALHARFRCTAAVAAGQPS
jgi:hypothetical protein